MPGWEGVKNNAFIAVMCAVTLGACAQSANDIAPAYVSPITYSSFTCPQIADEAARLSSRVALAAGVRNNKATNDAVATGAGVVLFFPALFFIKGDSTTGAELARLKGEMEALETASIQKNCNIAFRASPPA